jgi:hypothetical protein
MLNLYAVRVWHPSAPHYGKTIDIRTYTVDRAEYLATESHPGCAATARLPVDPPKSGQRPAAYLPRLENEH